MKSNTKIIELNSNEIRNFLMWLNDQRNKSINDQRTSAFITALMEKVINAPTKKKTFFKRVRNER